MRNIGYQRAYKSLTAVGTAGRKHESFSLLMRRSAVIFPSMSVMAVLYADAYGRHAHGRKRSHMPGTPLMMPPYGLSNRDAHDARTERDTTMRRAFARKFKMAHAAMQEEGHSAWRGSPVRRRVSPFL